MRYFIVMIFRTDGVEDVSNLNRKEIMHSRKCVNITILARYIKDTCQTKVRE